MDKKQAYVEGGSSKMTSSNEFIVEASPLAQLLIIECNAMAGYSLRLGDAIAPDLLESLYTINAQKPIDGDAINQLVTIHRILSSAVAPATPGGILALQKGVDVKKATHFLGPIPLVRHLTTVTILLLCVLIGTSLSSQVNYQSINHGLLASSGLPLVLNLFFLLSCSGLGGCFSLLYKLNQYVINANYDSKYDSTYWVRLLLGIVAGLFIVELLPKDLFITQNDTVVNQFSKPVLAMLGGFSATMVYRILQRLVDTIESFIKGDPQSLNSAENRVRKMQLEQHKQNTSMQQAQSLNDIMSELDSNDFEAAKALAKKAMQSSFPRQAPTVMKNDKTSM